MSNFPLFPGKPFGMRFGEVWGGFSTFLEAGDQTKIVEDGFSRGCNLQKASWGSPVLTERDFEGQWGRKGCDFSLHLSTADAFPQLPWGGKHRFLNFHGVDVNFGDRFPNFYGVVKPFPQLPGAGALCHRHARPAKPTGPSDDQV